MAAMVARPRSRSHDEDGVTAADQRTARLLKALAHPARVALVRRLAEAPRCVHELVGELGLDQPLVSQHLRVLRSAGVLSGERQGREIVYSLRDDHVAHIVLDAVEHSGESTADEAGSAG